MEDNYTRVDDATDRIVKIIKIKKFACNIDSATKHLSESMALTLSESGVDLFSSVLGHTGTYNRISRLHRLPFYLTLQFVRFFWKKKENVKAKITRAVNFPFTLDMYEYCTPALQAQLLPYRNTEEKEGEESMQVETNTNQHGVYELYAVLSHRGRSSDGGHYISFVRQSDDEDDWLQFDDEKVSRANAEDIKKLSGTGGVDWHICYMCIYKSRKEFKKTL